jgi:pyruvate dehydrogenase E1 component alpha subunit
MDVQEVYDASRLALEHVRSGLGPYLLECETYRFRGHSMADSDAYRSGLEMAELRARDPLLLFRHRVEETGWLSTAAIEELEAKARQAVDEAVVFAEGSPPPRDLYKDVYQRPLDLYRGAS